MEIKKIADYLWEIPPTGGMRVPGRIYASQELMKDVKSEESIKQVMNVAHLPGILKYSLAMPDIHWGYGFPIGGVAATDAEEGVISPGGIGFDVNCLTGNSLILNAHGYTMPIAEFATRWSEQKIHCCDLQNKLTTATSILRFIKLKPQRSVYRVITATGERITATEDHPFYTRLGMKPLEQLNVGDEVAIYGFEGVPYEEPSNEVILDEEKVREKLLSLDKDERGNCIRQIINRLKERGLLPLRYNSPQLPYILKLMGYLMGDGTVHFVNSRGKGVSWFYGKTEDLEEIRKDVEAIGFTPSRIYSRHREHRVKTFYRVIEFSCREASFKVAGSSFAVLMSCLSVPVGNKAKQDYLVPEFLFKAVKWQKRLFLAALFGAEMNAPKTYHNHKYNFYCPILAMNKREGFVESGKGFLLGISKLLEEFQVETKKISQLVSYKDAKGEISYCLRLILSTRPQDLINLWSKIGFEYNHKRSFLASVAARYIKAKQLVIGQRKEIMKISQSKKIVVGASARMIYSEVGSDIANFRFIENLIYKPNYSEPRVPDCFPTFDEFLKVYTDGLGESGLVWDRIIEKSCLDNFDDFVYDFTVDHSDHNFIANNFLVHN